MNTLFIQFYSKSNARLDSYELENGFSDTYDFCKSKGDMLWMKHSHTHNKEKTWITKFPISTGVAYISTSYMSQLYQCYLWANEYPNVKFIIGGPITTYNFKNCMEHIPKNLIIETRSIEKLFNFENFKYPWKLKIPSELCINNNKIIFSYTMDNCCYWGNCNFCAFSKKSFSPLVRTREKMNCEFQELDYKGLKVIRLNTEALNPTIIKKIIPKLPIKSNLRYRAFLRPSIKELNALKELNVDTIPIKFSMGLEYPSQKMWNYIKKGYNKKDVLNMFQYLLDKNAEISFSIILGWNNLIENDLKELESFMNDMPVAKDKIFISLHRLFVFLKTEVYDLYEKGEDVSLGPLHMGFYPKLNKEQIELNMEAKKIIMDYIKKKEISIIDTCDLNVTSSYLDL